MPHQQSRRQETRCRLPGGEVVFVEEGSNCPRISGQQGSARRRLFWEEEGAIASAPAIYPPWWNATRIGSAPAVYPPWWNATRIGAAPQRPPARPGGPLPGDRSYTPREGRRRIDASPNRSWRRTDEISHTLDDRPAYRGGGYGFPHPWPISQEAAGSTGRRRVSAEYVPAGPVLWGALLAGLGIGAGFLVINKLKKG